MKGLVLFRSYYGNTKQIAEVLAEQIRLMGHDVAVRDVGRRLPDLDGVDFVMIGAPTRMAKVGRSATAALKQLRKRGFAAKPIAVFDTYGPVPTDPEEMAKASKWLTPGAAGIMQRVARDEGLNVYEKVLRCQVRRIKGPLENGELRNAASFASEFLSAAALQARGNAARR